MNRTQNHAPGRALLAVLLVAFPGGVQIARSVADGAPGATAPAERVVGARPDDSAAETRARAAAAAAREAGADQAQIAEAFARATEEASRRAARDQEEFLARLRDADPRRDVEGRVPAQSPPPAPARRVAPPAPVVEDDGTVLQPTSTNPAPPSASVAPAPAEAVKKVEAAENAIR